MQNEVRDEKVEVASPEFVRRAMHQRPKAPAKPASVAPLPVAVGSPELPPALDVAELVGQHTARVAAAERLIEAEVGGRELLPDEDLLVRSVFPKSERAEALRVIARRLKTQATAGTRAQRDAAAKRRDETAGQLAAEGPGIEAEIAKLQERLAKLEQSARNAASESERREAAAQELGSDPTFLAPGPRARYEFGRRNWEATYGRPARVKRQEAEGLRQLADSDPEEREARDRIVEYASKHPKLGPLADSGADGRHPRVNRPAWEAHVVELREQADELDAEANELESAGAETKRQLDAMLAALVPE